MSLTDFLSELSDESEPLKYSRLLQLAGLSSDEALEFKGGWAGVPVSRRQSVLEGLAELCQDNLELDFSDVFRACLDDGDDEVRLKATQGLWESDDRTLIRPLIGLLRGDPSGRIRAEAAMSLGKFASMAQNGKLLAADAERIRKALVAAVDGAEEDVEVSRRAIEAVAFFDHPEIDEMILQAHRGSDQRLKQSSLYAMGQSSNGRWLPVLLDNLYDELPEIRYEAASAAGHLGDESTAPQLIRLIQDEDAQVQLAAVKALGSVGGPLARQALKQCLKMGDEVLEEAATEALGNLEFDDDPLGFRFEL